MTILDNNASMTQFLTRWDDENCFVEFVLTDSELHPRMNSLSLILVKFIEEEDTFVIPVNHNEAKSIDRDILFMLKTGSTTTKFTTNKKLCKHAFSLSGTLVDASLMRYLMDGSLIDVESLLTQSHKHIYSTHYKQNNLNKAIPILKWGEYFESLYKDFRPYILDMPINKFYNTQVVDVLSYVESSGLHVDPALFSGSAKHVSNDDVVYTEYNLYTSTGRPSNTFGGINYSALNKSDGTRDAYTSRFGKDGKLVMFDYEAYHPRLVASLIKYILPSENIYEWLGRQYYNKHVLSDEDIESAKIETFKQFYGGIEKKYVDNITYLFKLSGFIDKLWLYGNTKGYIPSPISGRKIYLDNISDITKQKLFNYLLQLYETEMNITVMGRVKTTLSGYNTKLTLYTYDAFLFDVDLRENENNVLIKKIYNSLNPNGKYPVRVYIGNNYQDMHQIDLNE